MCKEGSQCKEKCVSKILCDTHDTLWIGEIKIQRPGERFKNPCM